MKSVAHFKRISDPSQMKKHSKELHATNIGHSGSATSEIFPLKTKVDN